MMFRGAYDSDFYRHVRDLLHEQVTLQQSKAGMEPAQHRHARINLDARWDALIASEQAHRTRDATFPSPATPPQTLLPPLRHAATTQRR
jgi:anaerobic magnesium-protoporphyrin IX monomethyl ester cyclase